MIRIHIENLILFAHHSCWYVEHFLQSEICCIHNGILIIHEILSHECRRIHRHCHKHAPKYRVFFSWVCTATFDILFCLFLHFITCSMHKFCCITSHDEILRICRFLRINIIRLPWSITKWLSVPYGLLNSVEKSCFVTKTNLLYHSVRNCNKLSWSILLNNITFPFSRTPNTVIVQFWIIYWREPINLPWSITCNNRFPKILFSEISLPRAYWSRGRHDRKYPCC